MEVTAVDKPNIAERIDPMQEGRDFLELPVVSASAMDSFLEKQPGSQKLRSELIRTLHWQGNFTSLGRWGRVSLNHVALLGCLATGRGWGRSRALELGQLYNQAGLAELLESGKFAKVLEVVDKSLHGNVASAKRLDPPRLLHETLKDLVVSNPAVREIAFAMTGIVDKVDRKLSQVRRHFGYVERIEGDEALSVIRTGGRDELRAVDTKMLRAVGINAPKDAFILYEFQWSPETVVSLCVPAVLLRSASRQAELASQEAELRAYETPLRQRPRTKGVEVKSDETSGAQLRNTATS